MQHDPLFLLSESSGAIAAKINEIAGMDSIDIVRKRCDFIIEQAKSKVSSLEGEIEDRQTELRNLDYLDKFDKDVFELETLECQLGEVEIDLESITEIVDSIMQCQEDIKNIEEWLVVEKDCNKIIPLIRKFDELGRQESGLFDLMNSIDSLEEKIEQIENSIKAEEDVKLVLRGIYEYETLESEIGHLGLLYDKAVELTNECEDMEADLQEHKEKYLSLIKKAGSCPVCWSTIDRETIRRIGQNL